jgi:hypothetical protein
MNNTRGSTPSNPTPDLPIRSTNSHKTLGIVGTPHGHSIAKLWSTKTHWIKRNRRISAKNTTNPRPTKTSKLMPFAHGFGMGIKGKRIKKGSSKHPSPNPKGKGLKTTTWKSLRNGSKKHQKGETGTTPQGREEPRRFFYTYHKGFVQGLASARSSFPLTRSHHEALKLVLWKN